MQIIHTAIPEVLIIEPRIFADDRGFFLETYQQKRFDEAVGAPVSFVQDNHSGSQKNILRGLHYQVKQTQGKLVRVIAGSIYDVAVDIRRASPTFGKHVGVELNAQDRRMLWVPEGFAHGFLALTEWNEVLYKATDFYAAEHERCIRWDDTTIAIDWPLSNAAPVLSPKDAVGAWLADAEIF
jgi:dTDP-4-dehydrorhamnose 3,5-epimerase